MKGKKIDVAFCSHLSRSKDTLKEVLKYHPECKKTIVDDRIIERCYGDLQGHSHAAFIRKHGKERKASMEEARQVLQNENFYCDISLRRHSIDSLDNEPKIALKKLNERDNVYKMLPDIDCGICGAPTCKSFAEDVVQGRATIGDCNIKSAN